MAINNRVRAAMTPQIQLNNRGKAALAIIITFGAGTSPGGKGPLAALCGAVVACACAWDGAVLTAGVRTTECCENCKLTV